jgi:predicted transcriptional regulator
MLVDEPDEVWSKTSRRAGISREFFDEYFGEISKAIAFEVQNVFRLPSPILLDEITSGWTAPQGIRYLDGSFLTSLIAAIGDEQ